MPPIRLDTTSDPSVPDYLTSGSKRSNQKPSDPDIQQFVNTKTIYDHLVETGSENQVIVGLNLACMENRIQSADPILNKDNTTDHYNKNMIPIELQNNLKDGYRVGGGRAFHHCRRLLGEDRSVEERNFALVFIEQLSGGLNRMTTRTRELINWESNEATTWWTLAPYIYKALMENGLNPEDSLSRIFKWADDNKSDLMGGFTQPSGFKGLEDYSFTKFGMFILGRFPDDFSHQFANAEGERLVAQGVFGELLTEKSGNPSDLNRR
jgi:hypothetical protein